MKKWIIGIIALIVIVFLVWLLVLPIESTGEGGESYPMYPYVTCNDITDCIPNSNIHLCCINKNYEGNIEELTKYEAKCNLDLADVSCRCYTPENWDTGFCTAYDYTYKPCTGIDCARMEARKLLGI